MRRATATYLPDFLEHREVELGDRVVDQAAVVLVGEHLARDLRGGRERQLRDLAPDLLERALRLGRDLAPRLLDPAFALLLGLLLHAALHRLGHLARLGEDLLGLVARLSDQRAVLLEQPPRLVARVVGLLERLPDAVAALVDRLLDRPE